jgi:hypothetical protein
MWQDSYIGYIEHLGGDGWLKVLFDNGFVWPLPEYLKVYVEEKRNNREYFSILEGKWKGKNASVKKKGWGLNDWDGSYFEDPNETTWYNIKQGIPYEGPAELTFYRKSRTLKIKGVGEFSIKVNSSKLTPIGVFDIEIPYEPHDLGLGYISEAQYSKTWFRIGHSGDRFIHCGTASLGCITVEDIHKWDRIYKHLILSRKDSNSVGVVTVIDQ